MITFKNSFVLFNGPTINKIIIKTFLNFIDDCIFKGKLQDGFMEGFLTSQDAHAAISTLEDEHYKQIRQALKGKKAPVGKTGPSIRGGIPQTHLMSASTFLDIMLYSYQVKVHEGLTEDFNEPKYVFLIGHKCGDMNLFSKIDNTIKDINRFYDANGYYPTAVISPIDFQKQHIGLSSDFILSMDPDKYNFTNDGGGKCISIKQEGDYFDTFDTLLETANQFSKNTYNNPNGVITSNFFTLKYYDKSIKEVFEERK